MARINKAPQSVTVNPEKIVRGLTTVFQGFSIMFDGMAEQMQLMQDMTDQLSFPSVDTPKEDTNQMDAAEIMPMEEASEPAAVDTAEVDNNHQEEETPPWEEPKQQETSMEHTPTKDATLKEKPAVTITQADLTKVIVSKIKLKRDNNARIGKLLGAYGVKLLSDLPEDKYEAFLNDLSQL